MLAAHTVDTAGSLADAYCWKMRPPALIVIVNVSHICLLLFVVSVNTNNNKVELTLNSSSVRLNALTL